MNKAAPADKRKSGECSAIGSVEGIEVVQIPACKILTSGQYNISL